MLAFAVAVSALVGQAECAVVYVVPENSINVPPVIPRETIFFDLDDNGVDDIAFEHRSIQINVLPQATTRVIATVFPGVPPSWYAENLAAGDDIGPALVGNPEWGAFSAGAMNSIGSPFLHGDFTGGFGFLAVKFDIAGETHYGWMEVESFSFAIHVEIHRWAYESEPGKGILAGEIPEPDAFALLLMTAVGAFWRRRGARDRRLGARL